MTENEHELGAVERRILDAALEVIARDKISGTRMRAIAEQAEMSQGNLHYYFDSKADLFSAVLEDMLGTFVRDREGQLLNRGLSPARKLRLFFDQMQGILLNQRGHMYAFYDFWVQGTADEEIRAMIQRMYRRWREDLRGVAQEGSEAGDFDPAGANQIPTLMVSLMEGAALQYLIDGDAVGLDEYFDAAWEMVEALLRGES